MKFSFIVQANFNMMATVKTGETYSEDDSYVLWWKFSAIVKTIHIYSGGNSVL